MTVKTTIHKPTFTRQDDRGLFVEVVDEGPWETVIHGTMLAGSQMGNHYHKVNKALFYLVSGSARVTIKRIIDHSTQEIELNAGEGIYFLPYEIHTIYYHTPSDFLLFKSYRYKKESPDIYLDE